MLTPTGAKLLDFGLAKPAPLATGVTLTAASKQSPVTEQGTIIGTFQYMSPEQIEAKELDGAATFFRSVRCLRNADGSARFPRQQPLASPQPSRKKEPAHQHRETDDSARAGIIPLTSAVAKVPTNDGKARVT